MAGALVGGAFLSASLQVLFDRIASLEVLDFIKSKKLDGKLLKKLEITLVSVNTVLDDAEEKQIKNKNVNKWLDELKHVVYDAEDLLDEISTEALRDKVEAEFHTSVTQVQKFFSTINPFNKGMNSKLEEVLERLEFIAKQKNILGLREGFVEKPSRRFEETSVVDESGVYGRNAEKKSVIELLLSDDADGYDIGVVTIAGMGGICKTTLAQLVYNDNRVKEWFNFKAWVCVSEEFDIFTVTKTILEQVTSSATDIKDLNGLQLKLMESLTGKKFLIVLDDVWNENYFDWEKLLTPFSVGLQGSKIIVTTRNEGVAAVVRTGPTHYLNVLTDDDFWLLFARHAFGNHDNRAQSTPEMVRSEVVKRCKGLPLAAKALGSLLRVKSTFMEWNEILKSDIWEFSDFILPALRISYLHLPSHLKRCFAYCSVFPKDYKFKREQLIELWMAENLLHQDVKNRRMEEVGEQYFHELVSRSLFQRSSGNTSSYVMHDLVHDLARFVSGEFSFWLEGGNSNCITEKTHHLSYLQSYWVQWDTFKKFEGICRVKNLRTFLPFNLNPSRKKFLHLSRKVLHDLLPKLNCLRVLSLSQYTYITELPESIGDLKYLRLLDLSWTAISRLPNSTATLYNL